MKKDKVYWIVYYKVKKKHPAWSKRRCGVVTYNCLLESGNKK